MHDPRHTADTAPDRDAAPGATPPSEAMTPVADRISFRRRLLVTLGSMLAVVFLILGILTWFISYGWLNYQAQTMLKQEADEIAFHIISPGGRLRINRYAWHEPHHRFSERRIDPYFVQVFDARGNLLRASANIQDFPAGAFPQRLLATKTTRASFFTPLRTFRAGEALLYYDVFPLRGPDTARAGYIQVARYEPGIAPTLRRITLLLLFSLGLILAGLLGLTQRIAHRVLQPLESITKTTDNITSRHLHRRFAIPDEADRETAQLAATLNTLLDRLEHAFEEMRRFTADAAHELQTPLTVLRGHVDVALRRPRTNASYQETLHLLGTEIDNLTRMVRGLLGLARLDREPTAFSGTAVNLTDLVQETVAATRAHDRAAALTFEVRTAADVWINGKPDLVREVLINVLDNAVKYTPHGSITVTLKTVDEQAQVTITDTGGGIPPEALPHVTERFYRAAALQSQDIPGSGLGLSLVSRIMVLHDGTLEIQSTPEQGTTVTLTFPTASPPTRAPDTDP